jgi:hypothetical protein
VDSSNARNEKPAGAGSTAEPRRQRPALDPAVEILARHFGARDTPAWRSFLGRLGNVGSSAAMSGAMLAREAEPAGAEWLLIWPIDPGRLAVARPVEGRAERLGVVGGGTDDLHSAGHARFATFGPAAARRARAALTRLLGADAVPAVLDLQAEICGADRRRRFARSPETVAERLGLRWLAENESAPLQALAALLQWHLAGGRMPASRSARGSTVLEQRPRLADWAAILPGTPGVYRFLDAAGKVYYVGSTRDLRRRLWSYLNQREPWPPRLQRLLGPLDAIEVEPTGSELSARLLEDRWIRSQRPAGNRARRIQRRRPLDRAEVVLLPHAAGGWEIVAIRPDAAPLIEWLRQRVQIERLARRLCGYLGRRRGRHRRGAAAREAELVASFRRRRDQQISSLPANASLTAAGWRRLLGAYFDDVQARREPVVQRLGV